MSVYIDAGAWYFREDVPTDDVHALRALRLRGYDVRVREHGSPKWRRVLPCALPWAPLWVAADGRARPAGELDGACIVPTASDEL